MSVRCLFHSISTGCFPFSPQKRIVVKNGFAVIFEIEILNISTYRYPFSLSLQEFVTSKLANLKCNILFLKKNDKYLLDIHCSVRIRSFDKIMLNQKPLFNFFLGEAFAPIPVSAALIARHTALVGALAGSIVKVYIFGKLWL